MSCRGSKQGNERARPSSRWMWPKDRRLAVLHFTAARQHDTRRWRRSSGFLERSVLEQRLDNPLGGVAVAVRIDCASHPLVLGTVVEKPRRFVDDAVTVGANDANGAGLDGLGPLGDLAQHQDGSA